MSGEAERFEITGASVSFTLTINVQDAVPEVFVAVADTVVFPTGNK